MPASGTEPIWAYLSAVSDNGGDNRLSFPSAWSYPWANIDQRAPDLDRRAERGGTALADKQQVKLVAGPRNQLRLRRVAIRSLA